MAHISQQGDKAAEQFAELQEVIEGNKQYVAQLLIGLGHKQLTSNEQDKENESMDALKCQVDKCHREVMDALQKISSELAAVHSLLSLLSERKQGVDKEQKRTELLNRHALPMESVTWSEQEVLGKGAFGTVFQGSYHGSQVAVKVIPVVKGPPRLSEKQVRSLENEVILLKEVEFPAVLHCYGFARDPATNSFIIVTEVAPLGSLDLLIFDDSVTLPAKLKVAWFADISNSVEFVHSRGIKHGDIKAQNFLVYQGLRLKLADFGLAREQSSFLRSSTVGGGAGGTMGFMAPELLSTGTTCASDIYSYGMTVVQIITGDDPKQGNAEQQIRAAVAELDLSQVEAKEALLDILIKCCVHDAKLADPASVRFTAIEVKRAMSNILRLAGGDIRSGTEMMILEYAMLQSKRGHQAVVAEEPNGNPPFGANRFVASLPHVPQIPSSVELFRMSCIGDASVLQKLSNAHVVIPAEVANEIHSYTPAGLTSVVSVLHSLCMVLLGTNCLLVVPSDRFVCGLH